MTQTITRPTAVEEQPPPPPHPHYTLGTLIVLGIIGTLVAVGIGISALMITASRNSVDDALVAERVDTFLEDASTGTSSLPEDVLPSGHRMSSMRPRAQPTSRSTSSPSRLVPRSPGPTTTRVRCIPSPT